MCTGNVHLIQSYRSSRTTIIYINRNRKMTDPREQTNNPRPGRGWVDSIALVLARALPSSPHRRNPLRALSQTIIVLNIVLIIIN